ncbi:MAG: hypothetical protein K2Y39_16965 [Candidatus Obscuribacterales bacterium]|nr:hypothetical protein [Candidatus Obscuribacterales bacterium]
MPNEIGEISPRQNVKPEQKNSDALIALDPLFEVKSQFAHFDKSGDSRITREELTIGSHNNSAKSVESHLLKNFGNLSGGTGAISEVDIDRAILGNLTIALEESSGKSELDFEVRSGIAKWAAMSKNKNGHELQNQINSALSGTGMRMYIQNWKTVNYMVETVPVSTITLVEGKNVLDKFSFVKTEDARISLLAGRSIRGGCTILDQANPRDSYNNELTKQMSDLKALQHLMNDRIIAKDGEFSLEAMTNYKSKNQEQAFAKYYLQYYFGKLAPRDGKGESVSKTDLRIEMEEKLSLMIANSLSQSKGKNDELVDRFIRTSLQDEYVGLSHTFANTLNAALEKHGYKASLSPISDGGKYSRTLSIESKSDAQKSRVIDFLRKDSNLSYKGYENSATAPFGSR